MDKLPDSEIVKALEEHYKQVDKGYTDHLTYGGKGDEHEEKYIYMLRDVLDLINRLQAENEHYSHNIKEMTDSIRNYQKALEQAKAENERLKYFNSANVASAIGLESKLATAKAEAVKEFAEEYKDQIKNYTGIFTDDGFYVSLQAVLNAVDFIKEKLGGDSNG